MYRFTVAELFKQAEPVLNTFEIKNAFKNQPDVSYSVHQQDEIKKNINSTGGIPYTLKDGLLCLGVNDKTAQATGDIFFNPNTPNTLQVSGLSNYTKNAHHSLLVFPIIKKHLPLNDKVSFIQAPASTLEIPETELFAFIKKLNPEMIQSLLSINSPLVTQELTDEDDLDGDVCFLENSPWRKGSSASPHGLFGQRQNKARANAPHATQEPSNAIATIEL
ncbi:MAG: hypothetical protein K0U24_03815 [Gammaproteobacteria bacterium]|nr:hypothetical protein [Gammaproteobacteria bacterium]MCH9717190.1 hypothetical protein [Gammaproteobacteria bacterium]MCH9763343.1 hypothetical protein [Gammaproteobacteria bacterium]